MRKQSVSSISYYYCTTPGLLCTLVQPAEGTKRFHNFWAPCFYTWSLEGRSLLVSPLKDYWCPFLRRRRKVEPTLEIKRYSIQMISRTTVGLISFFFNFALMSKNKVPHCYTEYPFLGWIVLRPFFFDIWATVAFMARCHSSRVQSYLVVTPCGFLISWICNSCPRANESVNLKAWFWHLTRTRTIFNYFR